MKSMKMRLSSSSRSAMHFGVGLAMLSLVVPANASETAEAVPSADLNPALVQPKAESAALPEASEIFDRYIEAIGGWEKLREIKNRRITGTYQGDPFQFKANVSMWWEADGRFHQRVAEPAGLRYQLFVVDNMTWSVILDNEPQAVGGIQRQELLDTADFYGEANYKARYKEIKTVREAKAGDDIVYVVSAITHAGRPHTLFFNKETGLLIGNRVPVSGPNGTMRDMTVRILNYKEVGGTLYPTLFIQDVSGQEKPNRFEFTTLEINVEDGHEYPVPQSVRDAFEAAAAEAAAGSSGAASNTDED